MGHATGAPPRTTKMEVGLQPSYKTCSCHQVRKTCSCVPSVGHATGPHLSRRLPLHQKKGPPSCDQVTRHGVVCPLWDMPTGTSLRTIKMEGELQPSYKTCSCVPSVGHAIGASPLYNKKWKLSCNKVIRHAVGTMLKDIQLTARRGTCN